MKGVTGLFHARVAILFACLLLGGAMPGAAGERVFHCFPTGPIYEYRWKLLELALTRTAERDQPFRLAPYAEDITQTRSVSLLQSGAIDVLALGTNAEREAAMLPIRIDILKGIIGFRVFLIRREDQPRIARMDAPALRQQLTFGLLRDWADLPIMVANGFVVEPATRYENLFTMLAAGRFDAFPRGINEVYRDLAENRELHPQLVLEQTKALYFPYPVFFWVSKERPELARRLERGLKLALADGSFKALFTTYYAEEIGLMKKNKRQVLRLANPVLPPGTADPDTSWWWPQ